MVERAFLFGGEMPVNTIAQNGIITKKLKKWDRVTALLSNDEELIEKNFMRRFPNEAQHQYDSRKKYFVETFINSTQDLVSAPVNSVFGQGIKSDFEKKNSMLRTFHENVTLGNDPASFNKYLKDYVGVGLRSYGNVFTVVDKPRVENTSRLDEREQGMPFLSNITPQRVLNWLILEGELQWFAYESSFQDPWTDPFQTVEPTGKSITCLITKDAFIAKDAEGTIVPELSYNHGWGFCPVVMQSSFLVDPNDVIGNAAMDQTSNMIITAGNLLNLWVHELYKHGGSLLMIPEDAITATNFETDKQGHSKIKKQDSDGAMNYDGEIAPAYLVKELVVAEIQEAVSFWMQRAVENERDLKSVVKIGSEDVGKANSSGVAKMMDREPLESNLTSLAEDFETYTKRVDTMVAAILLVENDHVFEIDKSFDLRPLQQKFDEIESANVVNVGRISPTMHKEMYKNIIGDITRDQDVQKEIAKEIDASETVEDEIDGITKNLIDGQFSDKFKGKPNEGDK